MNEIETAYTFKFEADTKQMRDQLKDLNVESLNFGNTIKNSFEQIIFKGKNVESIFKSLGQQLSRKAFSSALKPIENLFDVSGPQNGGSLLGQLFGFAKGGAFSANGGPTSGGGVINSPLAFPMNGGNVGIAGEAGPEAILPLTRSANGELGVRAASGGGTTVNVHISTNDIESFRRSEGEIAATLQRVVSRGNRNL